MADIVTEIRARVKQADELREKARRHGEEFAANLRYVEGDGKPTFTEISGIVDIVRKLEADAAGIDASIAAEYQPTTKLTAEPEKPSRKAPSTRGAADAYVLKNLSPNVPITVEDVVKVVGCGPDTARRALK